MAYQSKNLSALGYSNGFTLWHYRTDDALAGVLAAAYFDGAARMLREGDVVIVNACVDSGPRETAQLTVASSAGGSISMATMTAAIAAAGRDDPLIEDARDHLGAALKQALPSDDQNIIGHMREAHALLRAALKARRS